MEASLKPDNVKVDTNLAEDYLQKNEQLWADKDITSTNDDHTVIKVERLKYYVRAVVLREKFMQLAELIQENAQLFSQLEFMRRGISPEEVISSDIKLLVQNLLYISTTPSLNQAFYDIMEVPNEVIWLIEPLEITREVPLAHLGFVTQKHSRRIPGVIHASADSLAVCTLFSQLCETVGLEIELHIAKELLNNLIKVPEDCTGVIAECSDLDSAVDTLLGSTTKYPWKLTRILVQESVYETFQNVLEYKCKRKGDPEPTRHLQSCSKAFVYGDKTFLLDFFGENNQHNKGDDSKSLSCHFILVEAYRTRKELLAIVQKPSTAYLSLWCSDISAANEVASNVNSRAVWINDYALFSGPTVSSQIYYGIRKPTYETNQKIVSSIDKWSKLNKDNREKILRKCVKIFAENDDDNSMKFIDDVLRLMFADDHRKFDISNGTMCVVERRHVGIATLVFYCHFDYNVNYFMQYISEALAALRYGSGIIYSYLDKTVPDGVAGNVRKLFEIMQRENVPVIESDVFELRTDVDCYEIKAVWTTFGTIFAN